MGLVTFSSEAETLVPPTTDREAVRTALATLNANGGTAMGDGLARALDVIEAARQEAVGGRRPDHHRRPQRAGGHAHPDHPRPERRAAGRPCRRR